VVHQRRFKNWVVTKLYPVVEVPLWNVPLEQELVRNSFKPTFSKVSRPLWMETMIVFPVKKFGTLCLSCFSSARYSKSWRLFEGKWTEMAKFEI
jgi:hypothetical protein